MTFRGVLAWLFTDPSAYDEPSRNYQAQNDDVGYLFGGRLRTAKRPPRSAAVAAAIAVCGILYWIHEAKWDWHHLSPAVPLVFSYLWILTAGFFVSAATADPGVLPRNLHLPFDKEHISEIYGPEEYFSAVSLPSRPGDTAGVAVKYCATCHVWRPPRTSHCAVCNCCVAVHDHHCKFLNNCVGSRNYRHFLWFLVACTVCSVYLATVAFVRCRHYIHNVVIVDGERITSFRQSIAHTPISFVLALGGTFGAVYPSMLLVFHIFLTGCNYTTREYLNYVRPGEFVNVYDGGIWRNLWTNWVATPRPPSFLRRREAYVAGDITLENVPPLRSFQRN